MVKRNYYNITRDISIMVISILVAVLLVKTGVVHQLIDHAQNWKYLGIFVSGMFFTSTLTTAPAIVALGEFTQSNPIWVTALFGAAGAVVGDMIIFKFVRNQLQERIADMAASPKRPSRLVQLFKNRWFRWVPFFIGGLIIASPFPDEIGVGLMGISHANTKTFAIVSFVFNFIGVVLIGLVVRAV